jgi:hypothetical protein
MNFWTYLVNDCLFSEFLAAFHGFTDMCLCAELGNYIPFMYSDIGLEPGAAGVTVDTTLDEVVGSVGGDSGVSHDVEEDVEENGDHHRKNAE